MIKQKMIKSIEKHLGKTPYEQGKEASKLLKFVHKLNHELMHMEEVVIVLVIALFSFMLAHYTGLEGTTLESKNPGIEAKLQQSIQNVSPGFESKRVISQWKVDSKVENTFYKGYCTYGAALISPDFFPYTSKYKQQRTRGGNAVDRYLNAQTAGFKVGSEPRE
ncbi:MAG: hypothetical protein GXP45_06325 [bacterium]|nr:hypothetical protein [bacterium]